MNNLSDLRKVFNIESLKWELLENESKDQAGNIYWFNLSYDHTKGEGSYLYKMEPNTKSKAITPSQDTDSKNEVVQIDELKDLDLESTGVLDIESGGFSKNMWNGTSHSKAILLLKNLI